MKEPNKNVEAPELTLEQQSADEKKLVAKVKKSGVISILIGVGLIVLGVVITVVSYYMAKEGGSYIFAWGPMVFGVFAIFRGLFTVLSPYRSLHKQFDTPTQKRTFLYEKPHQSLQAVGVITVSAIVLIVAIALLSKPSSQTDDIQNYNAKSSSLKTAYDNCNAELDTITKKLNDTESRMDAFQAAGDQTSYEALVEPQNTLVDQYNDKTKQCDADFKAYNESF